MTDEEGRWLVEEPRRLLVIAFRRLLLLVPSLAFSGASTHGGSLNRIDDHGTRYRLVTPTLQVAVAAYRELCGASRSRSQLEIELADAYTALSTAVRHAEYAETRNIASLAAATALVLMYGPSDDELRIITSYMRRSQRGDDLRFEPQALRTLPGGTALLRGESLCDIANKPLADRPEIAALKTWLSNVGEGWEIWFPWFERRMLGQPDELGLETIYLDAPESFWRSPRTLNDWISGEVSAYLTNAEREPFTIEDQNPTALIFAIDEYSQKIDIDDHAGRDNIRNNRRRQEIHAELVRAMSVLLDLSASSNLTSGLYDTVLQMKDDLGANPSEIRPHLAVIRGNRLRILREVNNNRAKDRDPDAPPFPDGVAGVLSDVIGIWNMYVSDDPYLEIIDASRADPILQGPAMVQGALDAINSISEYDFSNKEASAVLADLAAAAESRTIAAERAYAFEVEALRNFTRATFRLAASLLRVGKIAAVAGAAIVSTAAAAVLWIQHNAAWLKMLLQGRPAMLDVLQRLLEILPPG